MFDEKANNKKSKMHNPGLISLVFRAYIAAFFHTSSALYNLYKLIIGFYIIALFLLSTSPYILRAHRIPISQILYPIAPIAADYKVD